MRCHYDVLGVSRESPAPDIRKAYHRLCLQYHPDKNKGSIDTTARFQEVAAAYEILRDPEAKIEYDKRLRRAEKGKRHEMEVKLRNGAWEMDARRKKAQQDNFMRTWHEKYQDMDDDSQGGLNAEKTYYSESFCSNFENFQNDTRPGPSSATTSDFQDFNEPFMSNGRAAKENPRTYPSSFGYAAASQKSRESFTSSYRTAESELNPGPPSFAYASASEDFSEAFTSNSRHTESKSRQDSSTSAGPSAFDYSTPSFVEPPPATNRVKRPRPRKSYAEYSASDIFPDYHDDSSINGHKETSRPASQPAAPSAPWPSPTSHDWQRAELRNTKASAPAMPTVSEDEAEKKANGSDQQYQPNNPIDTQGQNLTEEKINEERINEEKGNGDKATSAASVPSEPKPETTKNARMRRNTRPPSWRFEPVRESIPARFAAEDGPTKTQRFAQEIPQVHLKPQLPPGLDYSFMFNSGESLIPEQLPKDIREQLTKDIPEQLPKDTPKPNPLQRPKSVFQKARDMSYQKLDELCSKLMTKGAKAKKDAKLAAKREVQQKIVEDGPLQRQLSKRAGKQRAHNVEFGSNSNEAQLSGFPREIAEWRIVTRREYATQRASFENRRMNIENQIYEQHRILEMNTFAVKSLAGDYRIREAKIRGMSGFFMNSTVFHTMDNDPELVKLESDRVKSENAAEQASRMIQLLKQKMREEKQHYTKAVHMARVQNSRTACRFLKEKIDPNSPDASHPKQRELCLGIWESVGSISIEEALSGTADRTILENLLLYQQWIETKESDKEIQLSKLDFFHKNQLKMDEEDKSSQEDIAAESN